MRHALRAHPLKSFELAIEEQNVASTCRVFAYRPHWHRLDGCKLDANEMCLPQSGCLIVTAEETADRPGVSSLSKSMTCPSSSERSIISDCIRRQSTTYWYRPAHRKAEAERQGLLANNVVKLQSMASKTSIPLSRSLSMFEPTPRERRKSVSSRSCFCRVITSCSRRSAFWLISST